MHRPDPDATRAHWDALAADYDAAKARNAAYFDALLDAIDGRLPAAARRHVLDVGCGTGRLLARLAPGAGLGIDASGAMVEQAVAAHAERRPELQFRLGDAAAVAALGPFTGVVSADLLEHVPDWRAAVRSIAGACGPGGTIVLATPNPAWAAPLFLLEKLRLKMPEGPHVFVHRRRIADELLAAGCRILECGTLLAVPMKLGGVGPWLSRRAAGTPGFRGLGVIQVITARKDDDGGEAPQEPASR